MYQQPESRKRGTTTTTMTTSDPYYSPSSPPSFESDFREMNLNPAELDRNGGEEDPEMITYKPFHVDLQTDRDEPEEEPNDSFCYICYYGQHASTIENNMYHGLLLRYMEEQYHQVSSRVYTQQIQDTYNTFIRGDVELPRDHPDHQLRVWRKDIIYEHIEKHTFNPAVSVQDTLMVLREVRNSLRDNAMFLKHKVTGAKTVDRKSVSLFLMISKHELLVMKHLKRPTHII
jgi:hypothetical protein